MLLLSEISVECWEEYACVLYSVMSVCATMDFSLPGSSVHGISQARILEWVAFESPGDFPEPGIKPASLAASA